MLIFVRAVYALLFLVLLLEPHLIRGHLFPAFSPYADSLVTLIIFFIGGLVYWLHQYELRRKENQNKFLKAEVEDRQGKLLDSFKYLGLANRRVSLIKRLASDPVHGFLETERHRRQIFEHLLQDAVISIANAGWGHLRIIDAEKIRTLKEVSVTRSKGSSAPQIGNKELLEAREGKKEVVGYTLVSSTNRVYPETCFLILPKLEEAPEGSMEVLQAVADQAHLLYRYAYAHA